MLLVTTASNPDSTKFQGGGEVQSTHEIQLPIRYLMASQAQQHRIQSPSCKMGAFNGAVCMVVEENFYALYVDLDPKLTLIPSYLVSTTEFLRPRLRVFYPDDVILYFITCCT